MRYTICNPELTTDPCQRHLVNGVLKGLQLNNLHNDVVGLLVGLNLRGYPATWFDGSLRLTKR